MSNKKVPARTASWIRAAIVTEPPALAQPDAAEEVVGDQVGEERHDDHDEQEIQHEPVERQVEGVEADVEVELRIGLAERGPVQEHLDRGPGTLRDETGECADDQGRHHGEPPDLGHDGGPVARERIVGSRGGARTPAGTGRPGPPRRR